MKKPESPAKTSFSDLSKRFFKRSNEWAQLNNPYSAPEPRFSTLLADVRHRGLYKLKFSPCLKGLSVNPPRLFGPFMNPRVVHVASK